MRFLLSIIATFITWSFLDFIIHGLILQSTYEATADLWRPMEEMKTALMYGVTLIMSLAFVSIYALFCGIPSWISGLKFGALIGLFYGAAMGIGSYCYMPIPLSLSLVWFFGILVEMIIGGIIVGSLITKKA